MSEILLQFFVLRFLSVLLLLVIFAYYLYIILPYVANVFVNEVSRSIGDGIYL